MLTQIYDAKWSQKRNELTLVVQNLFYEMCYIFIFSIFNTKMA